MYSSVLSFVITGFLLLIYIVAMSRGSRRARRAREAAGLPVPQTRQEARRRREAPVPAYDAAHNTAAYPVSSAGEYDLNRARDELDTLLQAGHLTSEEYHYYLERLKNYHKT